MEKTIKDMLNHSYYLIKESYKLFNADKSFWEHIPPELIVANADFTLRQEISQNINISKNARMDRFDENKKDKKAKPAESKAKFSYYCNECNKGITKKVFEYSKEKYEKPLCYDCQQKHRR